MNRLVMLWLCCGAGLAWAQAKATLIDAPLDVKVPLPAAQRAQLQTDFRQLLVRKSGALMPTTSAWKTAVAALRRQDCDVRDECLQQLAVKGASLYALYVSIERNAAGTEYLVSGRVVNQDNAVARAPVQLTASAAGKGAALLALEQLIQRLELTSLPPVLEKQAPVEAPRPAPTPAPMLAAGAPPPPPPLVITAPAPAPTAVNGGRIAAFSLLGLGIAAGATSATFGILAASGRSTLPVDGRFTSAQQAEQQQQVNTFASVSLGSAIGAGASLAAALVLFGTVGRDAPSIALVPSPEGVTAAARWSLP